MVERCFFYLQTIINIENAINNYLWLIDLAQLNIVMPDFAFHINITEDKRLQRIKERRENSINNITSQNADSIRYEFDKFNLIPIDNNSENIKDAENAICKYIL